MNNRGRFSREVDINPRTTLCLLRMTLKTIIGNWRHESLIASQRAIGSRVQQAGVAWIMPRKIQSTIVGAVIPIIMCKKLWKWLLGFQCAAPALALKQHTKSNQLFHRPSRSWTPSSCENFTGGVRPKKNQLAERSIGARRTMWRGCIKRHASTAVIDRLCELHRRTRSLSSVNFS